MKRAHSFAAALVFACAASTTALANTDDGIVASSPAASTNAGVQTDGSIGADFGGGANILQIPAAEFQLRSGAAMNYTGLGYLSSNGAATMWAPVFLPSGAEIQYLDIYYCDNSATAGGNFYITRYEGYNDANRVTNDLVSLASADGSGAGCAYDFKSFSHTINNNVRYGGGGQYVINVLITGTGFQFKAVDLWWNRQISPAPASASFTDVPTSHPFFQMIEAMKASGITSGCTATTYCPNDPVTRGQMAVFLARALGLYWPY